MMVHDSWVPAFGWLCMIFFWGLVALVVVALAKSVSGHGAGPQQRGLRRDLES